MTTLDPSVSNLPADVLDRPAPEVARWLALVRLHDLDRLRPALDDAHDGHAADELHDFRVALRRLRSVIRAHRAELDDSVSTKTRRRLQRLARASAPSRDATVHLAWLAEQEKDVTADQSPGVAWVRRQIRKDRRAGDRQLEQEIERDYARVSDRLHEKLSRYAEVHELEHDRQQIPGRSMLCATVHQLADELESRFADVSAATDERELHRARIAGKRLRYEIELLVDAVKAGEAPPAQADDLVNRLKELQDQLGDIHDSHVFGRLLADRAAEAGARRSRARVLAAAGAGSAVAGPDTKGDPEPGIAALERRLRERAERCFDAVRDAWSPERRGAFLHDVHALADEIGDQRPAR